MATAKMFKAEAVEARLAAMQAAQAAAEASDTSAASSASSAITSASLLTLGMADGKVGTYGSLPAASGANGLYAVIDEGAIYEDTGAWTYRGTLAQQTASSFAAAAARRGGPGAVLTIEGERGGVFKWAAAGTDDDVITFPALSGKWVRQWDGQTIPAQWGGVAADAVTNDHAALQNLVTVSAGLRARLDLGAAHYYVSGQLDMPSNLRLYGQGAKLIPDPTIDAPIGLADGAALSVLTNIEVDGVEVDGTARAAATTGGFGTLRFNYVLGLRVANCTFLNVHEGLTFRAVEFFVVDAVRVDTCTSAIIALLADSRLGVISNLVGTDVGEAVDMFENEDVVVTNVVANGVIGATSNEGIDLSCSRRIRVSNCELRGFHNGVLVKTEAGGTPWSDISLQGIRVTEHANIGIVVQESADVGAVARITVKDCTVISTQTGARGIRITPSTPGVFAAEDLVVQGCYVDVPGIAFETYGYDRSVVEDSTFITAGGSAYYTANATTGLVVRNNYVRADGGVAGDAALLAGNSPDVVVDGNEVYSEIGYGLRVANCMRPRVTANRVTHAGVHGIYVNWSSAATVDAGLLCMIDGNQVYDWGQGSVNRYGIVVLFTAVALAIEGLLLRGNTVSLTPAAAVQNQYGYACLPDTATLSRCMVTGNWAASAVPIKETGVSTLAGVVANNQF